MISIPVKIAYGIRKVALWMFIPFFLMFIPPLVKEFSYDMSTVEVLLKEESYSSYPDDILCFKADVNGKERLIYAPVTAKVGDNIKIILRDGEYYKSVLSEDDIRDCVSYKGRFLGITDNKLGYHVPPLAAVLLISFLISRRKANQVRESLPKLSKITDIAGIICAVLMSIALIYGMMSPTLTSMSLSFAGLFLGIGYTAVFTLAWLFESILPES